MEVSSDPYEQKLYQMFQSCKTSQQQTSGLLDEASLTRLCQLLQLRDQGSALISSLTASNSPKLGVSFEQFKEALLNFLGTEFDGSTTTFSGCKERSLVITDEPSNTTYVESPVEAEASDREVSPKLIVGTKKYGRRSRPHNDIGLNELSVTDSDNTDEDQQRSLGCGSEQIAQVQRSSSQSDLPGSRRVRSVHYSGSKLKRCASLPARKNLQIKMLSSTAITTTSTTVATQVGSGNNRSTLRPAKQDCSSVESLGNNNACNALLIPRLLHILAEIVSPQQLETISAHSIIETWEMACIVNSGGLLHALGFDEEQVNIPQLTKVLEEELRGLEHDSHTNMLRALVALQSMEIGSLRQVFRQQYEENLKLRADNKAANQRVALLAAEVDERHALLEENCKQQVQQLEQRHASVIRELTQRMSNDRDHWTNMSMKLEAEIKHLEQEEIKLKTELELVRNENNELEMEQQKAHLQITELLEKNIKLNQELANFESLRSPVKLEKNEHADAVKDKISEEDELLHVMEKMTALQMENAQLRDKTDELTMEIENLYVDLARTKSRKKKSPAPAVVIASTTESTVDGDEQEAVSIGLATKRRGDSPSKTHITEESPRLGKQRKCSEGGEVSDNSGDWLALNSELQRCKIHEEELVALRKTVAQLELDLQAATSKETDSSVAVANGSGSGSRAATPETRCKELENSLEQMQRAYEDCEDYWQSKLSEERQMFEKERQIYEDEQLESDKKFTELMEKVREYEEQFSKDGRLSPIDERDMLEQQYVELEAEAASLRNNSIRMLEEKAQQINALQSEVEDLRTRLGESVEILTGASEINPDALHQLNVQVGQSPASSPISYLWHQSTIQEPIKTFDGTADEVKANALSLLGVSPTQKAVSRNNLTTSETSIFSTTPVESSSSPTNNESTFASTPAPICKPKQVQSEGEIADCETSSTASNKSFDSHSIVSTGKTSCLSHEKCHSPSVLKEELKRLKFFELSLKEQIKDLSLQRDGLVMELQQLQEARPVLEKAYARTTHPTLQQRLNQLELRNRHLQNVIKQQQKYTESLMQQSWRQHQVDLNDLHGRIEAQTVMLADQTQRLQNADILVKDLYVENSHLTATVQRLEQQRARVNLIHQQQQQQQQHLVGATLSGLSGMP
ncbi:hypothetical protein KR222_006150 [Zaprionus bogoriensis]|nr:hypothetical protein KR222_006150 [Zaprionus bogoriensis]